MIIFGTLGFTPQKFLPSLRHREDVDAAVVFHDDHPDSKNAAAEVGRFCRSMDVKFESVAVDAFDIVACASAMQKLVHRHGPERIVFNVTGGTKVIAAAAILTCFLEGLRAVYIHDETHDEIALPLVTARYDQLLTEPQRRVLRHIAEHPRCTQHEVGAALGISKPTTSHHVKQLMDFGLITQVQDQDDGRKRHLDIIPSARLLLGGIL